MVFAVVVIVVAGLGLPFVAWGLGRSAEKRRGPSVRGLGPPSDAVDKWLIENHGLPAPQRWQVRNAVIGGRAVPDQSLRPAAHELADRVRRGQLRLGRGLRIGGTVMVAEGVAGIVLGVIVVLLISPFSAASVVAGFIPAALGAWFVSRGLAALRMIRKGAERAYQLNA